MFRLGTLAAIQFCLLAAALGQQPQTKEFRNAGGTFHLDLPAHWRQLAPNEARRIAELPGAPADLGYVEPRQFYAVGPVERWLAGDFSGPWLWVVEQGNEWQIDDDFADKLEQMWREKGQASGVRHELAEVAQTPVGTQDRVSIVALRTTTPPPPAAATRSLDVHAPSGGQQISLSFVSPAPVWSRWEPEFRRWLATLTFARHAQEERSVGDRLWGPIITGALVGLILLLLYKHVHRRS